MTGSFHRNSDVDTLYIPRKLGGRGLKLLLTTYECRIISIKQHLLRSSERNHYITKVIQHEQENFTSSRRTIEIRQYRSECRMYTQTNQPEVPSNMYTTSKRKVSGKTNAWVCNKTN